MKHLQILIAFLMLGFLSASLFAVSAPPDQPSYFSDVHGGAALAWSMHKVGQFDKSYLAHRDAALRWTLKQAKDAPQGGRTWVQNPSAPKNYPTFNVIMTPSADFIALTLLDIYRNTKDPKLLKAVKDHVTWLKNTAINRKTPYGTLNYWGAKQTMNSRQNNRQPRPLVSGHSHGLGNVLSTLSEYYAASKDETLIPYMEGGTRFAYATSTSTNDKGSGGKNKKMPIVQKSPANPETEQIHWIWAGTGVSVMGYCRGNAGCVYALETVQKVAPGIQITEARKIEDVVNAGLRYIIENSIENKDSIIWKNMNGRPGERNMGYGRGVSGIAIVLWRGYEMNRKAGNKEMAKRCRKAADETIRTLLEAIEPLDPNKPLTEHVAQGNRDNTGKLQETIGICSGISGSYVWLFQYADAVRKENPKLAKRCEKAAGIIAHRLINTAVIDKGTYAWKNYNKKFGGEKVVNMAFDHGQTGVVSALADIGARLKDKEIMNAAKKAADFVLMHCVKEGNGLKMPFLAKIDPNAKPVTQK
ncbi:MAG: hypothetical protein HN745_03410 [Deltaproteobacteria bacterium]|jgi:hypothetical protein|nr:hypothetical protein [Deltaproteobacteria bacterium]MBT7710765.1 hypothetical protein [Deltaproteobacteria bacterium]